MTAIWYRARAELRARWKSWLSLALMLGIFAGMAMTAAGGARRTKDAYPRFLREMVALDVFVADFSLFAPVFWKVDFEAIEALPYVKDTVRLKYFPGEGGVELFGSADPRLGTEINRRRIVEGRAPRNDDEVLLPFAPRSVGGKVGDTVKAQLYGADDKLVEVELKIVGRALSPGDLPPTDILGDMLTPTPGFVERYQDRVMSAEGMMIRLDRGAADIPRFRTDLERLAQGKAVSPFSQPDYSENVQRSFDVQALGLWAIALLVGLVGVLLVSQTVSRQILLEEDDEGVFRALGMSRGMRVGATAVRALLLGVSGAAIAAAIAVATSPLFPRGQARVVEPDPGARIDWPVLVIGCAGVVLLALAVTLPVAFLVARAQRGGVKPVRGSRLAGLLARMGARPPVVAGVRLALERGSGRGAVPVRTSISAVTIGIAALLAIFTFGASLDRLLDTPGLYGVGWDHVYGFNTADDTQASFAVAKDEQNVAGVARAASGISIELGPLHMEGVAVAEIEGTVFAPPEAGRLPGPGEVYLGPRTARELGHGVGDRVKLGVQGAGETEAIVSGIGILPPVSETSQFGQGVLFHEETLACLVPGARPGSCDMDPSLRASDLLVNFEDGVDVRSAVDRLRAKLVKPDQDQLLFVTRGVDLINFGRLDDIPLILAGLVVLVAAGALSHVLVSSIRRRRRDLAILRTLGFKRGQTRAAVAWQATAIAVIALLLGIPAGIAAGRALWITLAERIGVVPQPAVHWDSVWLAIPITLVVANLIATLPARAAARTSPAGTLRIE